jgi:hypothetical protein
MKLLVALLSVLLLVTSGALLWRHEEVRGLLQAYVENGDFLTLEVRQSPEEVMEAQRSHLIGNLPRTYQRSTLKYHPYLLLEVKYTTADKKTQEGVVLWSLVDGEILLDTDTWERTHGYYDAISSRASREDFKMLHALARHNGQLTLEQLQRELRLDEESLESQANSVKSKQLVIQKGNTLQLHFQNPKLIITPRTAISQRLVTKPYGQAQRLPKRFSTAQIEDAAKAAFGSDFAVRASHEVLLPFYAIEVLNTDGSVMTSYWNALTGQRIPSHLLAVQRAGS